MRRCGGPSRSPAGATSTSATSCSDGVATSAARWWTRTRATASRPRGSLRPLRVTTVPRSRAARRTASCPERTAASCSTTSRTGRSSGSSGRDTSPRRPPSGRIRRPSSSGWRATARSPCTSSARMTRRGQLVVGLFGRGELRRFEHTDARGRYEFSGLPAGVYVVHAGLEDPNPGLGPRVVELEERARVEIELRARDSGTTLELSLSGPGAADLEEVCVGLVAADAPPVRSVGDLAGVIRPATMDARRSIPFLAPGRYGLIVLVHDGDDVRFLTRPVDV